jgi:hypothetical protein
MKLEQFSYMKSDLRKEIDYLIHLIHQLENGFPHLMIQKHLQTYKIK